MSSSLKFFFTEPMEMAEPVEGLEDASRVFVSGSDLATQMPGLSAALPFEHWGRLLASVLGASAWTVYRRSTGFERLASFPIEGEFADGKDLVFLGGNLEQASLQGQLDLLLDSDRKQMEWDLIPCLLHYSVVIFPVPATAGFDLEVYTAFPIKSKIISALEGMDMADTRRFILNAHEARSEQKFHFDLWALNAEVLPTWVKEV